MLIPGTQVGRQIDGLRSRLACTRDPRSGRAMRQRAEDQRALLELRVIVGDEAHLDPAEPCTLTAPFIGARETELEGGVTRNESAQLTSGVTGRAEHSNRNFMHVE